MKYKIPIFLVLLITSMVFTACEEDEDPIEYSSANLERLDPVLIIYTPFVAFVAGEPNYTISYQAYIPSGNATSKVNVYSSFTDSGSGETSAEVLLYDHPISIGENAISESVTYEKLKEGITVNGNALPGDAVEIPVGSQWNLRFEPVDGSGKESFGAPGMVIGVASPFAGIYTVIESTYTRIGVPQGGWDGATQFIGSVNATTFSHDDLFGPFATQEDPEDPDRDKFVFELNADNTIFIPDELTQLIAHGDDMLTCQEDAANLSNANCPTSNVLIPSADGKHIIKLTYGYYTTGSGAREFYEVLEKKL